MAVRHMLFGLASSREQHELQSALIAGLLAAPDYSAALLSILREVALVTGWAFGQAWTRPRDDDERLICSFAWWGQSRHVSFRNSSERVSVRPGVGIVGEAWAKGVPIWLGDVTADPRLAAPESARFVAATAIPVRTGDEVVAVVEFFIETAGPRDQQWMSASSEILAQLGILLDRRTVDEARRTSDLRFCSVTELAHDAIVCADERGMITSWNPAATTTFGWSASEVLGRPLTILVPARFESVLPARLVALALNTAGPIVNPMRLDGIRKGGDEFPLEASLSTWSSGGRTSFTATLRDVSERNDAEAALREREEDLATTLQSIGESVIATDVSGKIVRLNRAAERLTGWAFADAVGRRLEDVLRFVDPTPDSTSRQRRRSEQYDFVLARDGSRRPVIQTIRPIRDAVGVTRGVVAVFRDITDQVRAREHQQELERRLSLADHMASIGTLASGVAHEINNPLAYVMTNLAMIADELPRFATESSALHELSQMVEETRAGAERIRLIVRDLKRFSRVNEEVRGPVNLRRVIDAAANLANNEIRHRARLIYNYGDDVPDALGNEARLGQVFVNLLVNAAQAIPEGHVESNVIRVQTHTDFMGRPVVEISDTGTGIPADILDRIFEPFFTTKAVGSGTGLGLAICHGIVTAMDGEISVRSESGKGSVFTVVLPSSGENAELSRPIAIPIERQNVRRKVLIVDDEISFSTSLARALGRDHDVTVVHTGHAALETLRGQSFDVIVSDLMMPEMTGMELHAELSKRDLSTARRMIFMTGGAFTLAAREFLDAVPNFRIEKPFEVRDLSAMVTRVCSYSGSDAGAGVGS